jgi:ubiquinone/menaquinone biosynthesis C-methylase UbiE
MIEPLRDPEERELRYLQAYSDLPNARVLEIGSGDGRLTKLYASLPQSIRGIDIAQAALVEANSSMTRDDGAKVSFSRAQAEHLPFRSKSFDLAIYAWSF